MICISQLTDNCDNPNNRLYIVTADRFNAQAPDGRLYGSLKKMIIHGLLGDY